MSPKVPDSQYDPAVVSDRHLLPGTVIAGRVHIEALLGEGATAAVYQGTHSTLNKSVAVKVIHKRLLDSPVSIERFMREARAVNMLDHQGLARLYSYGEEERIGHYMVLEFIDGVSLRDKILEGKMSQDHAVDIIVQVCSALMVVHDAGLVHRDLKPNNIMVTKSADGQERTKVVDFGVVSFKAGAIIDAQSLTGTGILVGSPAYMSPEQCEGRTVDSRADVYSLGCVLFELLTGRPPFEGDTPYAVMSGHLHTPVETLNFPETVSLALQQIVLDTLQKDPEKRCPSVHALSASLKQLDLGAEPLPDRVGNPFKITLAVLVVMALCCIFYVSQPKSTVIDDDKAAKIGRLPPSPLQTGNMSPQERIAEYEQWLQRKEQGPMSQGLAHVYLAASLNEVGRGEDAASHFQQAFELLKKGRTDVVMNGSGQTKNATRLVEAIELVYPYVDPAVASEDLKEMIARFEADGLPERKLVLAKMYQALSRYTSGEENGRSNALRKQVELLQEGNAVLRDLLLAQVALSEALWREGDLQGAVNLLTQAIESSKELRSPFPGVFKNITMALFNQQRFEEALKMAEHAETLYAETGFKDGRTQVLATRCRALVALNQENTAFDLSQKSLEEAAETGLAQKRWLLWSVMAESDARGRLGKFGVVQATQKKLIVATEKVQFEQEALLSWSRTAASYYLLERDQVRALKITAPLEPVLLSYSSRLLSSLSGEVIALTELWKETGRSDLSIDLLRKLILKCGKNSDDIGVILFNVHLAQNLLHDNQNTEAAQVAEGLGDLAPALAKKHPDLFMQAYGTAGAVAEANRDFKKAESCYRKAFNIIEPGVRTNLRTQTLVKLGLARMDVKFNNLKEAEVLLHQCDAVSRNYKDEVREALLKQCAEFFFARGDLPRARMFFEQYGAKAGQNANYITVMNQYPLLLDQVGDRDAAEKWRQKLTRLSKLRKKSATNTKRP